MTEKEYGKLVKDMSPQSPIVKDCMFAFLIGGAICALGQVFIHLYSRLNLDETQASTAASMTLVAITGFANAISAPAIEFKTEGFILGIGAKMFSIAGPVIVYGISAGVVYGIIYWISTLF